MMLIEPASKASVPLTVVRRTRSRVAERALCPAENCIVPAFVQRPVCTHVFDASCRVRVTAPKMFLWRLVIERVQIQ